MGGGWVWMVEGWRVGRVKLGEVVAIPPAPRGRWNRPTGIPGSATPTARDTPRRECADTPQAHNSLSGETVGGDCGRCECPEYVSAGGEEVMRESRVVVDRGYHVVRL